MIILDLFQFILGHSGSFWGVLCDILGSSGSHWITIDRFGSFWLVLGLFRAFWLVLADCLVK